MKVSSLLGFGLAKRRVFSRVQFEASRFGEAGTAIGVNFKAVGEINRLSVPVFGLLGVSGNSKQLFVSSKKSHLKGISSGLMKWSTGSKQGFSIELNLKGVGFKAFSFNNGYLVLQIGFSHFHVLKFDPANITIIAKKDRIVLFSYDEAVVSQFAVDVFSLRRPDAYKAKGVQYKGHEYVLKEGKKK
jgi:ribosomal protein L6P/L9E